MLHRCCKVKRVYAENGRGVVDIRVEERITKYNVEGVVDPLPEALRGKANLELELVCTTACLASALGGPGEQLRKAVGSAAYIRYSRKGGVEELRVDGIEAMLVVESGKLRLRGVNTKLEERLEKCLLRGASLIAPKLEELLETGIELGEHRVYELGGYLLSLASNPLMRDALQALEPKGGCVEDIVSELILERLSPLAAASIALHDYISRSIIAYPIEDNALIDVYNELGDYGRGLGSVIAREPREASLIASKLLGASIEVKPVSIDGSSLPLIRVESGAILELRSSPLVALVLSLAASIISRRSLIVAIDAPVEKLSRGILLRELERVNGVLIYSRL